MIDGVSADDVAEKTPSVMERLQDRSLKPNDPVQFKGYVVRWGPCPDCPEHIPCEPCDEWMLVGDEPDAPDHQTIETSLEGDFSMEDAVTPGGFYLFRGKFNWWGSGKGPAASVCEARAWPVDD